MSPFPSRIIYHGPAVAPYSGTITAVLFLSTDNPKTGPCLAIAILPGDGTTAVSDRQAGLDLSVCRPCFLRSIASGGNGGCYVSSLALLGYSAAARAAIEAARYGLPSEACPMFMGLRLGAYGDPAALPEHVIRSVTTWAEASGGMVWGYTHNWRHSASQYLKEWCMASTESDAQTVKAQAKGWRAYQIVSAYDNTSGLASCESEYGLACANCGACGGAGARDDAGRFIVVHGSSINKAKQALEKASKS